MTNILRGSRRNSFKSYSHCHFRGREIENSAVHTENSDSYFLLNIHYLIKIRKINKGIGQLWESGNIIIKKKKISQFSTSGSV